jgi:hypothetical protein
VLEQQTKQSITQAPCLSRRKQFTARRLQQLSVLNTRRAHLLAGTATEAPINVSLKSRGIAGKTPFTDRPH